MQSHIENSEQKYYVNKGIMDKSFFNEYIRNHIQKNLLKKCDQILEDYEYIEYHSIGIKSEMVACYSELWFLDINLEHICKDKNVLLPVFIKDINTSSYYSLSRCSLNDDEIDNENYKTINEILNWCPMSCRNQIRNILTNSFQ